MANYRSEAEAANRDRAKGDTDDARGALEDLDGLRARFGRRLATPWWYKAISALIVTALFAGGGMPYESISFGSASTGVALVAAAVVVGPVLLLELLKRSTGASFDRYRNGWGIFSLALIGFFVVCVSLQAFADIDLAPLVGAAAGFVATYLYEQHTDRRLARGEFPVADERAQV